MLAMPHVCAVAAETQDLPPGQCRFAKRETSLLVRKIRETGTGTTFLLKIVIVSLYLPSLDAARDRRFHQPHPSVWSSVFTTGVSLPCASTSLQDPLQQKLCVATAVRLPLQHRVVAKKAASRRPPTFVLRGARRSRQLSAENAEATACASSRSIGVVVPCRRKYIPLWRHLCRLQKRTWLYSDAAGHRRWSAVLCWDSGAANCARR
jgi:hypothetical protein